MENKASFKGLIFILPYLGTKIFLNMQGVELAFYQLPGPVAAFARIIIAFLFLVALFKKNLIHFSRVVDIQILLQCVLFIFLFLQDQI